MGKKSLLILFLAVVVITVIGGFGIRGYRYRYSSAVVKDTLVKVYLGVTFDELMLSMESGGVVENGQKVIAFANDYERNGVKVGNYALKAGMTYRQLFNALYFGNQTPVRMTFNNVRTLDRLAGRLSRYTLADSAQFLALFKDKEFVDSLGFNYKTLPGMFLPNTYEIYWTETPKEIALRMKKQYDDFWTKERLDKAKNLGLSQNEVSTIASIVIEETKQKAEMTDVAGVYINRIKIGMPLQADPTVKFALNDFAIKRILNKHLEVNSPYNTYKNQGLPPGPIAIVDGEVVDAVLNYKGHDYLYFCAKEDFSGSHAFAKNLSDHNKNAARYHNELNRRKIR